MDSEFDTADQVPFTLVCSDCDAGMDIDSQAAAIVRGWIDIEYAPDLPMANFVGTCPTCQARAKA